MAILLLYKDLLNFILLAVSRWQEHSKGCNEIVQGKWIDWRFDFGYTRLCCIFCLLLIDAHVLHFLLQITMTSAWTFEEFKEALFSELRSPSISDTNLKVYRKTCQHNIVIVLWVGEWSLPWSLIWVWVLPLFHIYCYFSQPRKRN